MKKKWEIAYILTTVALVIGAFFAGKSFHEPCIPVSDIADYYVSSDGILTLEVCDITYIHDNSKNPKYTNYLAEAGIPDITGEMQDNMLNLSTVIDCYMGKDGVLTLHTASGEDWVIESEE